MTGDASIDSHLASLPYTTTTFSSVFANLFPTKNGGWAVGGFQDIPFILEPSYRLHLQPFHA